MKRSSLPLLTVAAAVMGVLLTGCGEKKTESGLTPEQKDRFGYVGMPMPKEAREAMQKSQQKSGPPAGAAPTAR